MSDYHRVCLHFDLRAETPPALIRTIRAVAAGKPADVADIEALPDIYGDYLMPPNPEMTSGVMAIRLRDHPNKINVDAPYEFYFECIYHDDEWANWGIYFMLAMFGHAAKDGYVASLEGVSGAVPTLYFKDGGEIIVVDVAANAENPWPGYDGSARLDSDEPVMVNTHYRFDLADAFAAAEALQDGDY